MKKSKMGICITFIAFIGIFLTVLYFNRNLFFINKKDDTVSLKRQGITSNAENKQTSDGTQVVIDSGDRKKIIKLFKKGFDSLKSKDWNKQEANVMKNSNIQLLVDSLNSLKVGEIPLATYANVDPDVIIRNLPNYYGESIYYGSALCQEVKTVKNGSSQANIINRGNQCTILKIEESHGKEIFVYIASNKDVSDFYSSGIKVNIRAWPVGIDDNGKLVLCCLAPVGG